jgi:hypothetical protein
MWARSRRIQHLALLFPAQTKSIYCPAGLGLACGADAGAELTAGAGGILMGGNPTTSFDGGLAGAGAGLRLGGFGGVAVSATRIRPLVGSHWVPAAAIPNTAITARTSIQAHVRRPPGSTLFCDRAMTQDNSENSQIGDETLTEAMKKAASRRAALSEVASLAPRHAVTALFLGNRASLGCRFLAQLRLLLRAQRRCDA